MSNQETTEVWNGVWLGSQLDKQDPLFKTFLNSKNRLNFYVHKWTTASTEGEKVIAAAEVNFWKEKMGQNYVDWLVDQMDGRSVRGSDGD